MFFSSFRLEKKWVGSFFSKRKVHGNTIADRLAKDAAHQALEMPVDTSIVTIQDIKNSSKKSIVSKWQQRRDISESGRFSTPSSHLLIANHT